MTPELALAPPEGVHVRMPAEIYHAAPAIGSSDLETLYSDPASYWYDSPNNPHRRMKVKRAEGLVFGDALHCLLLEGVDAFAAKFTAEPDSDDSRWLMDLAEVKQALEKKGVSTRGEFNKGNLYALAKRNGIAHLIYDIAYASYEKARRAGANRISIDDERRLRHMVKLFREHDDLGPALKIGVPELSVFWRPKDMGDILLRARFDLILPSFCCDLKSMANYRGGDPDDAAINAIQEHGYDLQAEHYREARKQLRSFVEAGQIFFWGEEGPQRLRNGMSSAAIPRLHDIAAAGDAWRWVWIFYQVRNDTEGKARAPVIAPFWADPFGRHKPLFDQARATIDEAIANYLAYRGEFGLDREWSEIRTVRPLPIERLNRLRYKRKSVDE